MRMCFDRYVVVARMPPNPSWGCRREVTANAKLSSQPFHEPGRRLNATSEGEQLRERRLEIGCKDLPGGII